MTDTDRQHLAKILGMLGSEHQGERDAAAIQAEAFRRKHGLTWAEMVTSKTIYVDREIIMEKPVYAGDRIVEKYIEVPVYRWSLLDVQAIRNALSYVVLTTPVFWLIFRWWQYFTATP